MFPKAHTECGYLALSESSEPGRVKVYYTPTNYDYLANVSDVVEAYWTNGCTAIITKHSDGAVRRWDSFDSYTYIRS